MAAGRGGRPFSGVLRTRLLAWPREVALTPLAAPPARLLGSRAACVPVWETARTPVHTENAVVADLLSYSCELRVGDLSSPKVRRSFQTVYKIVTRSIGLALNGPFALIPPADEVFGTHTRKPRRPAGSKQQGPVVVYGNEPTGRVCSDGAIRRPGGIATILPRPGGSTTRVSRW